MARSLNKVMFIGRMGDNAEIRFLPNGDKVATFSLATSATWKDKNNGERKESTQWHRLVAFRRLAEILEEYTHKGSKLYVEGRLEHRKYDTAEGTRWAAEIIVSDVNLLDGRERSSSAASTLQDPASARERLAKMTRANISELGSGSEVGPSGERDPDLIKDYEQMPPLECFDDDIPF
jgi:single-strand DNA-binding protein